LGSRIRIRHVAAMMLPIVGLFAVLLLLPEEALAAGLRNGLVTASSGSPRRTRDGSRSPAC